MTRALPVPGTPDFPERFGRLTALEQAQALARGKRRHERKYPVTGHGGDRRSDVFRANSEREDRRRAAPDPKRQGFTDFAAALLGCTARSIQVTVRIAERIPRAFRPPWSTHGSPSARGTSSGSRTCPPNATRSCCTAWRPAPARRPSTPFSTGCAMADKTEIEWTDATWNPVTGCSIASPGCRHCYAMRLAGGRLKDLPSRRGLTRKGNAGPVWTGEVRFNEQWLIDPLRRRAPKRIFVCAHGDLFHPSVPTEWIDLVHAVMACAPRHDFQVLTKRSLRMEAYFTDPDLEERVRTAARDLQQRYPRRRDLLQLPDRPLFPCRTNGSGLRGRQRPNPAH